MNAKNTQSHTELLAHLSDQLRDIAASGLQFSKDPHDLENYHTIQTIAMQLFALATDHSLEQIEPLREPIFSRRTPLIIGDGAVIDPHGKILLIQRPRSQAWALPGGAYAVGESPAQGVAREIKEETGISCTPTQLIGIYDSRLHPGPSPQHQYNLVFLCQLDQQPPSTPTHPQEIADIGWFPQHQLPTPITPSHQQRIQHAFQAWHGHTTSYFDKLNNN